MYYFMSPVFFERDPVQQTVQFAHKDDKFRSKTQWRPLNIRFRMPLKGFLFDEDELNLSEEQRIRKRFVHYFQENRRKRTTKIIDMRDKSILNDMKERIRRFELLHDSLIFMATEMVDEHVGVYDEEKFRAQMEMASSIGEIDWYCAKKFDYAEVFVELYGLERIIYPTLESERKGLKAEALNLLDTIMKISNETHLYAVNTDSMERIIQALINETSDTIRNRALKVLRTQLTQFEKPRLLIAKKGLELFNTLMTKGELESRLRILKVLTDRVLEFSVLYERSARNYSTEVIGNNTVDAKMNSEENAVFNETCWIARRLILETFDEYPYNYTHIGTVLRVLDLTHEICLNFHKNDTKLLATFYRMGQFYKRELELEKRTVNFHHYASILIYLRDYGNELTRDENNKDQTLSSKRFIDEL